MTFFRLLSAVLHDPLCVTLYNKVYVFKNKNRIKLFSTVSNFSKTTENMNLFTCLIFVPLIFTATRPETCIWVPKGYFPSCGYDDHHINQEWELKKKYKWAHERRPSTLIGTRLKAYFYSRKEIPCTMFRAWAKAGPWKGKLRNTIWMWEKKRWIWIIDSSRVEKRLLLKIWLVKNLWVL